MTPQQRKAMKLALDAFETLTQYNMVRANIFRRFEPTCTGDYVDLREFREKAKPAITALKEALMSLQDGAQDSKRPIEADYVSQVAYTRALEAYCDELVQPIIKSYQEKDNLEEDLYDLAIKADNGGQP